MIPRAGTGVLPGATRALVNVGANMLGSAWNGILIVLATPSFVSLLTLEGYGLIGFWLVMQVLLSLFDLGLGATIVREFADSRETADVDQRRGDVLRTFEWVYWGIALVITVGLVLSAGWISHRWLNLQVFPATQVTSAIQWMALALGLQFPAALYAGGLSGLQAQGRVNAIQIVANTARYGGGVAVLLWRPDPVAFFALQTLVAGAQTIAFRVVLRQTMTVASRTAGMFRRDILTSLWRYSAGMAFTTIAALLLGNIDRMTVSKMMPAAELGKYSLAFTATGLLQMGIQPFYRAYFPRFSELFTRGELESLRAEYYRGCILVSAIVIPFAFVSGVFAPYVFAGWVGEADAIVVQSFRWLILGIACTAVMWLPAALQQAQGWTRLHGLMIAGALVAGAPLMIWAVRTYGTAGAAVVWIIHGVSGVTLELWIMHRRILVGEALQWYRRVIVPPLLVTLPLVALSASLMPDGLSRWPALVWVGVTGAFALGATLILAIRPSRPNFPFPR